MVRLSGDDVHGRHGAVRRNSAYQTHDTHTSNEDARVVKINTCENKANYAQPGDHAQLK